MQPHAGGARAAVERERHWTGPGVVRVGHVRHDEHLGLRFQPPEYAVLVDLLPQHDAACRSRVGQRPRAVTSSCRVVTTSSIGLAGVAGWAGSSGVWSAMFSTVPVNRPQTWSSPACDQGRSFSDDGTMAPVAALELGCIGRGHLMAPAVMPSTNSRFSTM